MPRRTRNSLELPRIKLPKLDLGGMKSAARQMLVLGGVVVLILVMLNLNGRLGEYYRLSSERDALSTRVANLASTSAVLQTQVAYAQSDEAAEDYARSAHMIREGEQLVAPIAPPDAATPTPQVAQATQSAPSNWQVWWALFFAQ